MTNLIFINYIICLMGIPFIRMVIAIWFLNRENLTQKDIFDYSRTEQFVMTICWYSTSKNKNKLIVTILNLLLIISGLMFIGSIAYLYAIGIIK